MLLPYHSVSRTAAARAASFPGRLVLDLVVVDVV
jgi:hypothetical protein